MSEQGLIPTTAQLWTRYLGAEQTPCCLQPLEVRNISARDPQPHSAAAALSLTGPHQAMKCGLGLGPVPKIDSARVISRLDECHADALALGQTGAVCCAKPVTEMRFAKQFCCTLSDPWRSLHIDLSGVAGQAAGPCPPWEVTLRSCLTPGGSQCCPCTQGM